MSNDDLWWAAYNGEESPAARQRAAEQNEMFVASQAIASSLRLSARHGEDDPQPYQFLYRARSRSMNERLHDPVADAGPGEEAPGLDDHPNSEARSGSPRFQRSATFA